MSSVLLDTNVISELVRPKPDARVVAFVAQQADAFLSAITLHEIAYGVERAPDPKRRAKLAAWAAALKKEFQGRIIDIDADIAEHAGRLRAAADASGAPADPLDALIAASAASRGATLATRDVRDFAALGIVAINPWKA